MPRLRGTSMILSASRHAASTACAASLHLRLRSGLAFSAGFSAFALGSSWPPSARDVVARAEGCRHQRCAGGDCSGSTFCLAPGRRQTLPPALLKALEAFERAFCAASGEGVLLEKRRSRSSQRSSSRAQLRAQAEQACGEKGAVRSTPLSFLIVPKFSRALIHRHLANSCRIFGRYFGLADLDRDPCRAPPCLKASFEAAFLSRQRLFPLFSLS